MGVVTIIPHYLLWHYSSAIYSFFIIWKNLTDFLFNFFSIPDLLKTLFSGWRRLKEEYPKAFEPSVFFENLFVNAIMIVVGFVIRIFIIAVGLIILVTSFILGILSFLIWLFLPIVIIFLFVAGFKLIV